MTDDELSRRARRIARAVVFCFALLAGAIVCEVGLRVAAAASPAVASQFEDPFAILIEPYGEFGYRQKPGSVFEYPNGTSALANEAGYRGPLVEAPKRPGTARVILLGGSVTHGWGVDDSQTIDAYMREILAAKDTSRRYEVVNLAFDAHDSWQMYERLLTDGLPLDPDVVILNAGINDVRNGRFPNLQDRDPRTLIWEGALSDWRRALREGRVPLGTRIKHYSFLARTPAFLRSLVLRRPTGMEQPDRSYPDALDYFERNVRRVSDIVFPAGSALLLSTPPSAIPINYAPQDTSFRDYWIRDAVTTQEYRDSLAGRLQVVQEELASQGLPVRYVHAAIPGDQFLDDAHLTAEGNRALAEVYAVEVMTLLQPR